MFYGARASAMFGVLPKRSHDATKEVVEVLHAALLRRLGLDAFAVAAVKDLTRQHRVVVVEDGMVNIASWEEARKGAMAA